VYDAGKGAAGLYKTLYHKPDEMKSGKNRNWLLTFVCTDDIIYKLSRKSRPKRAGPARRRAPWRSEQIGLVMRFLNCASGERDHRRGLTVRRGRAKLKALPGTENERKKLV